MKLLTDVKAVLGMIAAVGTAGAVLIAVYSHFHTDAEAAQHVKDFENYQKQQYLADKQDRIDRHKREVNRIEYQLLSEDLSPKQIEYLNSKKTEMRDLIKCIREDREEC